jgi:pimeloyl-ACP methyl ester carboxylesterase
MNSPLPFVLLPPRAVAFGRLPRFLLTGVLVALLPACQGLRVAREAGHTTDHLEQAKQAWQVMEREAPGTVPAQNALRTYDRAVAAVVKSLRAKEGTSAWGKPVMLGGVRPWQLTFDGPARQNSARTFELADFTHCRLAADVKLHGFDRVVAQGGLGVPVVLEDSHRLASPFYPPHGQFFPATAVLEFPEAVPGRPAEARLRFYNPLEVVDLPVGRHPQPLAANLTAALEFTLTDAPFEQIRPHEATPSASGEKESQLYFLTRYDKTKVPVVFVPGMLSKPSAWKNTINELFADPDLRRRYQPVIFVYPPKLPIPLSAARLRELLKRSRGQLDPGHHDAGFGRMVLVGHSMGGLLARLQVTDSGTDFWNAFFTAPPKKTAGQLDDKTQDLMRGSLFFQRDPDVRLVVFIATPHRGSLLADVSLYRAVMRLLVSLPETARHRLQSFLELPATFIQPALRPFHGFGVEGIENLSTKHLFFSALARHPVGAPFHSIIAVRQPRNFRQGSDDVVPYWSAHLDGSVSETIVPYTHGCLERPATVQAIMKILKESK